MAGLDTAIACTTVTRLKLAGAGQGTVDLEALVEVGVGDVINVVLPVVHSLLPQPDVHIGIRLARPTAYPEIHRRQIYRLQHVQP